MARGLGRTVFSSGIAFWLLICLRVGGRSEGTSDAATPPSPLRITTAALPPAVAGTAYNASLGASGGIAPYAWRLAGASSLPVGLTLNPSGTITGTPASPGLAKITVTVTDAGSPARTQSRQFSIAVSGPRTVAITLTTPSAGAANIPLGGTQSLVASVTGTPNTAVSWSVAGIGDGNSMVGTISGGSSTTATYHAPAAMPPGNPLMITATALADISKTASVVLTLTPAVDRTNSVVAVGTQKTTGIDFSLARMDPTLGLADVGTCTGTLTPTLNVSCGTSVNGISAAQGARVIVWLLGQGLTSPEGANLAPGLRVSVSQGAPSDVTVSNLMPQPPQSGLTSIYFQIQVSPSATPGLRDLIVTNWAGELQHFVGAIEVTAGP